MRIFEVEERTRRRRTKSRRRWFEDLEQRLALHHDGGNDPLAYVQMYADAPLANSPPVAGPLSTISASPLTQNFTYTTQANGLPILNSFPSAPAAIYFDLDGDTNWGGVQPYSQDGDFNTFSLVEQQSIIENWWELSMYFSMFNVNVTTVMPTTTPMAWVSWGANPTTQAGLSQVDVFPNSPSNGSQSLAGSGFGFRIGDTLSHEVGHNFGNWHISTYDNLGEKTAEYAAAPDPLHAVNMGAGGPIEKWIWGHSSLGDSNDAARLQDDMAVIAADLGVLVPVGNPARDGYRPDDFAGTIAAATPLAVSGSTLYKTGVIERLTDADAFSFTSTGGSYSILVGRDYPSGVDVKVSIYNAAGQLLAMDDGDPRAQPYTMVNDSHLTMDLPAGTYYIVVESHGNYGDQGQYVVRVDPMAAGWQSKDIGIVRLPGYDSFNSGTYSVAGSGTDIQGTSDEFHFLYKTLTGNGSIVARLVSETNTDPNAKAGVMIRDSLAANAKNAMIAIKPGNTTQLQTRSTAGATTSLLNGQSGSTVKWMRLTRNGTTITAETSTNGTTWSLIGSRTVSMGSTVFIGLASTSHNVVAINTATFADVSLTGSINAGPTLNNLLASPTSVSVNSTTTNGAILSWNKSGYLGDTNVDGVINIVDFNNVMNNFGGSGVGDTNGDGAIDIVDFNSVMNNFGLTGGPTGYVVERSANGVDYTQVGTTNASTFTFTDSGLSDGLRYFYRVRAQTGSGVSLASKSSSGITRAGAVSNLRIISDSTSRLILDWTDAGGETGYRIERSPNGTDNWTVQTPTPLAKNTPMYVNTGLTANTQYFYRVVSADANGDAVTSNVVSRFTRLAAPTGLAFTTKASNQMVFQWNAVTGATGYKVERSTDGSAWSVVAANQAATTYTDNAVVPLGEYYYRVTANSANIIGLPGKIFAAAPGNTPLPSTPVQWTSVDIGAVAGTGAAGFVSSGGVGTFTVVASGADVWGSSDQFRYTYVPMTGNGSITARVASMDNTHFYARAGVMIRQSTAAGSRYASLMIHPSEGGVRLQSRSSTNGGTSEFNGAIVNAPYWIRLTRSGTTFTGEISPDGTTWTTVSSVNISNMTSSALVGLAVVSRDNNFLNTAKFDHVSTTPTGEISAALASGLTANSSSPSAKLLTSGPSRSTTVSSSLAGPLRTTPPAVIASAIDDTLDWLLRLRYSSSPLSPAAESPAKSASSALRRGDKDASEPELAAAYPPVWRPIVVESDKTDYKEH